MADRKKNIQQIKASLDMAVYRKSIGGWLIGMLLSVLYGWFRLSEYGAVYVWLVLGIVALLTSPMPIAYGYRMWKLFRAPEEYFFTQVTLVTPHQRPWLRTMYFTVVIDLPEIGTVVADTNPIFRSTGFEQPLLEDYWNKTVTIAYNRETAMVVVIG